MAEASQQPSPEKDNRETKTRENILNDLSERDRMILTKGAQLESSMQVEEFDRHMGRLKANVKHIPDNWVPFKQSMESWSLSPDELDAVNRTIGILQAVQKVSDKEGVVKRSSNKLPYIAAARTIFEKHNAPIQDAARNLFEAIGVIASDADRKEAAQMMGGAMSDQEMEEARKRVQQTNIR
jgi:hypothetical protein